MRSVDDLIAEGVSGRRVLLRTDLNVPVDKSSGAITDDGRIRASLPTLQALRDAGARVIVAAHLGRPKGAPDPQYSLAPVAARLSELLGAPVPLAADVAGDDARAKAAGLADGDVLLLENVRFEAAETSKNDAERGELADRLAALADLYVDDAFGAVHRKHASVYDVAQRLPHAAGGLVARELEVLTRLTTDPDRPYVVVLGGSKVSDKLAVIEALLPKVDRLLVGGGMCFTFLAAQGYRVGGERRRHDDVGRDEHPPRLEQPPAVVDPVGLGERRPHRVALGEQEGEAHGAADDDGVAPLQEGVDHAELVAHLRAAQHGDERPVGPVQQP